MVKFEKIKALPVLTNRNACCGNIKGMLYNEKENSIKGFVLNENHAIRKVFKYIWLKDILKFTTDAILIENKNCLKKYKKNNSIENLENVKEVYLQGRKIVSEDGTDFGKVHDFIFDEKTGELLKFVTTDGIFEDILRGRNVIPVIGKVEFGEDIIMIANEASQEISRKGGIG